MWIQDRNPYHLPDGSVPANVYTLYPDMVGDDVSRLAEHGLSTEQTGMSEYDDTTGELRLPSIEGAPFQAVQSIELQRVDDVDNVRAYFNNLTPFARGVINKKLGEV